MTARPSLAARLRAAAAAARAAAGEADRGMTLTELIVAMGIFTLVIGVFMSGLVVMTKDTARAQAVSDSGDQVRATFQKMDKEVRYASSVNRPGPGVSGGSYYVEYRVSAVDAGGVPICTQWRYVASSKTLEVRSWKDVAPRTPTGWRVAVKNVRNNLGVPAQLPFGFTPADTVHGRQQLRIWLDVGPGTTRKGSQLESIFVARNTTPGSQSNADADNNGQSDLPVCLTGVTRP